MKSNISPGNNTADKLLLLSLNKAEKYFKNNASRAAFLTSYAKAENDASYCNSNDIWFRRALEAYEKYATEADQYGDIIESGGSVAFPCGVRLAL